MYTLKSFFFLTYYYLSTLRGKENKDLKNYLQRSMEKMQSDNIPEAVQGVFCLTNGHAQHL